MVNISQRLIAVAVDAAIKIIFAEDLNKLSFNLFTKKTKKERPAGFRAISF